MPFTDNSDFYAAVHDGGINTIIQHIMRQRPSLFNYGTAQVQTNPNLLCQPIEVAPAVTQLIQVCPPIPLPSINIEEVTASAGFDFVVQLTDLELDFHPSNEITLPQELSPLPSQRGAFRARVCVGMSCTPTFVKPFPGKSYVPPSLHDLVSHELPPIGLRVSRMIRMPTGSSYGMHQNRLYNPHKPTQYTQLMPLGSKILPPVVITPAKKMECFCIELFGTVAASIEGQAGTQEVVIEVENLELVDIQPEGLENIIECFMQALLDHGIIAQIGDIISELAFKLHELPPLPDTPGSLDSIQLSASTAVANNPAIKENQLKIFTNLERLELNIPPIRMGGGDEPSTPTRTIRSRSRTGPSHLTAALSEDAFRRIFEVLRDSGRFEIEVGPLETTVLGVTGSIGASIEFHLDEGIVDFRNDNTVRIDELDIKWDKLDVTFGLDIPALCWEFCVWAFGWHCATFCLFEADPDFEFTLHIPAIFTSEISANAGLKTYYGIGFPNEWLLYLDPSRVDLDIIDISATVGDLLEDMLDAVIEAFNLPSWAEFLADGFVSLVMGLLDIPDDIGEWLQGKIFDWLGIEVTIESYIADWLADKSPLLRLEDPVTIMEADNGLIPVTVPIEFLNAKVNSDEMILEIDVGDSP